MKNNALKLDTELFRMILKQTLHGADSKVLTTFFSREFDLGDDRIRTLLATPPRKIADIHSREEAEDLQKRLEKLGAIAEVHPLVALSPLPFYLLKEHERTIKRELSKATRSGSRLALILVQVGDARSESAFPSMMGDFGSELSEDLRLSDTVIGIDDHRLLLLGFSTDSQGSRVLQKKVDRILMKRLREAPKVSLGRAVFPDEARDFRELMLLAESTRSRGSQQALKSPPARERLPATVYHQKTEEKSLSLESGLTVMRGSGFLRLLSLDARRLWGALSGLSRRAQKAFLNRIPINSPMLPLLAGMIAKEKENPGKQADVEYIKTLFWEEDLPGKIARHIETRRTILSALNGAEDLPTLPAVASKIIQIASDSTSSAAAITEVIQNDPSLTAKILKTVNSAYYGRRHEIDSLRDAVVLLGTNEIVTLSFGLASAKIFNMPPSNGADPSELWRHSVFTALIAQNLSAKSAGKGLGQVGAFTAGLLHDVGKIPFMVETKISYYQVPPWGERTFLPPFEQEKEALGISHAGMGKHLSTEWNLPESLVHAIAYHHEPGATHSHANLAAIVGFADYLYYEALRLSGNKTSPPGWLTYGHWCILKELFPGLTAEKIREMAQGALAIMKNKADQIETFK